jgi:hypothetical protein
MALLQDAFGHTASGLDRGFMRAYTPVDGRDKQADVSPVEDGTDHFVGIANSRGSSSTATGRLSKKLRSKLHLNKKAPNHDGVQEPGLATVAPTLAPPPPATAKRDRLSELPPDKPSLPPLKDFIQSPLKAATAIAQVHGGDDFAQNLATTAATHEASVKVVRAYEKIDETTSHEEEDLCRKDLELLKKVRQDSFVRWTLDRHVHKVGRLKARPGTRRPMNDFREPSQGGHKVMQWNEYGNHVRIIF